MASLISCVVSGVTFCFCSACTSLLSACCGNDKPSTVPPSVTSGRKRSVALLLTSVALSLAFQYGVAPAILQSSLSLLVSDYISNTWTDGCDTFNENPELQEVCVGNAGVYRVSFATMVFYILAAVGAWCKPTMNREAWPAKFILYFFLVAAMMFVPNEPLFTKVYLNLARIGGVLFIFLQQIIIVDCAHNWNDSWVARADKAETEEPGTGKKWLAAILCACAILFLGSIAAFVLMLLAFTGCPTNTAFIISTLCLCLLVTGVQLCGEEGSLLASAAVTTWAVYLLYNAVTKNPDEGCNPMLGQSDRLNIVLGLIITVMSLGWTGWSYTAEDRLTASKAEVATQQPPPEDNGDATSTKRKVTGVVTTSSNASEHDDAYVKAHDSQEDDADDGEACTRPSLSNSWRLNAILVIVTFWTSMVLTRWGDISTDGTVANPSVGQVAMWMIMASQWIALLLYSWTLSAPRLFPDREFS